MKSKEIITYSVLVLCIIALVCLCALSCYSTVEAENTDVIIDINSSTKFDTYSESFAYTVSNNLYVVANNYISDPISFNGECIDIAINNTNILLLVKSSTSYTIRYYSYSIENNKPVIKDEMNKIGDLSNAQIKSISGLGGVFNLFYLKGSFYYSKVFNENTNIDDMELSQVFAQDVDITNLLVVNTTKIILSNKKVYITSNTNAIGAADLNADILVNNLNDVSSITYTNGKVYANSNTGIYSIDTNSKTATKVLDTVNAESSIRTATYNDQDFIFISNNNAIIQYVVLDSGIEYYNKFDNVPYEHPTSFDILTVAKLNESAKLFSSPKNLQVKEDLTEGSYILILCEKEDSDVNTTYLYVATLSGTTGYIKKDVDLTHIENESNANELQIGQYAQGLHQSTKIYKSPYDSSQVIDTVDIFTRLVVINNVGEVDKVQVWPYYKVSYVKDDQIITGYVKSTSVSPYCQLTAPTILKSVIVTTKTIGDSVNLYTLPDENSPIITYVVDGTNLNLAEEYDKDSKFTKVVYNDGYAYILTESLQTTGLTSMQITIIIVAAIVFIGTVIMVVILVKRYKMGY